MSTDAAWTSALIDDLATVLGTIINAPVEGIDVPVERGASIMMGRAWRVRIGVAGTPAVTLAFDEAGAAALVGAVHGPDQARSTSAIPETLEELCTHTAAAVARRAGESGGTPEMSPPELAAWTPSTDAVIRTFSSLALRVSLTVSVSPGEPAPAEASPVASNGVDAHAVEPSANERLDVLLDLDLPLIVRFGCTDLPLKSLARLGPGSIIDLGRAPDDLVEVLVGNRVVARGEVVVVSGSYGIRIVDVVSPRERISGLEP